MTVLAVEAAPEPSPRFVLVQALAKGGRDELAVETCTELGVDEIVPWAPSAASSSGAASAARSPGAAGRHRPRCGEAGSASPGPGRRRPRGPAAPGRPRVVRLAALVLHEDAAEPLTGWPHPRGRRGCWVVGPRGISDREVAALPRGRGAHSPARRTVLRTSTAGAPRSPSSALASAAGERGAGRSGRSHRRLLRAALPARPRDGAVQVVDAVPGRRASGGGRGGR